MKLRCSVACEVPVDNSQKVSTKKEKKSNMQCDTKYLGHHNGSVECVAVSKLAEPPHPRVFMIATASRDDMIHVFATNHIEKEEEDAENIPKTSWIVELQTMACSARALAFFDINPHANPYRLLVLTSTASELVVFEAHRKQPQEDSSESGTYDWNIASPNKHAVQIAGGAGVFSCMCLLPPLSSRVRLALGSVFDDTIVVLELVECDDGGGFQTVFLNTLEFPADLKAQNVQNRPSLKAAGFMGTMHGVRGMAWFGDEADDENPLLLVAVYNNDMHVCVWQHVTTCESGGRIASIKQRLCLLDDARDEEQFRESGRCGGLTCCAHISAKNMVCGDNRGWLYLLENNNSDGLHCYSTTQANPNVCVSCLATSGTVLACGYGDSELVIDIWDIDEMQLHKHTRRLRDARGCRLYNTTVNGLAFLNDNVASVVRLVSAVSDSSAILWQVGEPTVTATSPAQASSVEASHHQQPAFVESLLAAFSSSSVSAPRD